MPADPTQLQRLRLDIRGRVQGVGFRPHVYRLAGELGLAGCVGNDSRGAFIEIEGTAPALAAFRARLEAEPPRLAAIAEIAASELPVAHEAGFRIVDSRPGADQEAEISPDVATCADCRRELFDPGDRRYGYPFINCTNCGPRYSIVRGIPYDRALTSMAGFGMCAACQAEYDDPGDRRFHAQPNACPACGPRAWLAGPDGGERPGDWLGQAAEALLAGQVLAIKGVGGFHLACRADLEASVLALRQAKGREAKPFAVMVPGLAAARGLVDLDAAAGELLASWQAPIVLAPRRRAAPVAEAVAPGADRLGLLLPYTPLHHLLLAAVGLPLVMTSANPADEPLCADNGEAIDRLGPHVQGFVLHNRDIVRRLDDSVSIALAGRPPLPVRRARGYVPAPLDVPSPAPFPILAVGGDLKSAVCLLHGQTAVLSEHLGELENPVSYRNFAGAVERLQGLLRLEPRAVACDLHPGYHSSRYARSLGLPVIAVQHHHAHLVSCLAENGLTGPVIGLSADGTGYGPDGTIWGGEILRCDEADFSRLVHLRPFPLVGGNLAAVETWRPALGMLREIFGDDWRRHATLPAEPDALRLADARLAAGRGTITTSLGRLFDGAACLAGIVPRNRYEAEAGMALEALAGRGGECRPSAEPVPAGGGLDWERTIRELLVERQAGVSLPELAWHFHCRLAELLAGALIHAAAEQRLDRVVLSGGCLLNRLLGGLLGERLAAAGLRVYTHRLVPPGDGGLALGQAVIVAARIARGQARP